MSNKLFTEEQVKRMLKLARLNSKVYTDDYLIEEQTPIKLPTDEEIEEEASIVGKKCSATIYEESAYVIGAKWMKSKIQGGNNEQ